MPPPVSQPCQGVGQGSCAQPCQQVKVEPGTLLYRPLPDMNRRGRIVKTIRSIALRARAVITRQNHTNPNKILISNFKINCFSEKPQKLDKIFSSLQN